MITEDKKLSLQGVPPSGKYRGIAKPRHPEVFQADNLAIGLHFQEVLHLCLDILGLRPEMLGTMVHLTLGGG